MAHTDAGLLPGCLGIRPRCHDDRGRAAADCVGNSRRALKTVDQSEEFACFSFPGTHLTVGISVLWLFFFSPAFWGGRSDAIAWGAHSGRLCGWEGVSPIRRKSPWQATSSRAAGSAPPGQCLLFIGAFICSHYFSLKGAGGCGGDALSKGGSLIRAAVC